MKIGSICIVDDNEDDRFILKRQLKKVGFEERVFESQNGKEAFDFLKNTVENKNKYGEEFPPVLIFLDINMPIMNGHEFIEAIDKEWKDHPSSTVIITYSTSDSPEDQDKMFKYPFVKGYLIKGEFTLDQLKGKLDELF